MKRKIIIALGVLFLVLTIVCTNDYVKENIINIHPGIFSIASMLLIVYSLQLKKEK
ncbi:hypothetical protein RJG79_04570 [Mycoplasmatota bacterium WC44]